MAVFRQEVFGAVVRLIQLALRRDELLHTLDLFILQAVFQSQALGLGVSNQRTLVKRVITPTEAVLAEQVPQLLLPVVFTGSSPSSGRHFSGLIALVLRHCQQEGRNHRPHQF